MIVPEYWAEAKVKDTINGSQLTIKRFGWSDTSEEDARRNAQERAQEAMERARNGESVRKVDHKLTYNGAEGLPIREQIVTRHDDTIITRNTYGALCLNTPDVFFADIDFDYSSESTAATASFWLLIICSIIASFIFNSWMLFFALTFASIIASIIIGKVAAAINNSKGGGPEVRAKNTIMKFLENHPEANINLYRTPMGFRVLFLNKTFTPGEDETLDWLKELEADPLYIQMCMNQKCFRARISPKPWRIDIDKMRPTPGVWPINPALMPMREKWIEKYTEKAKGYAACKLEGNYGSSIIDAKAERVRRLHDDYCKIGQNLPIA